MSNRPLFRAYHSRDEGAVRRIAFDSGFMGRSMAALLDDRRMFDRMLDPYLDLRRATGFVVEDDAGIAGYAVASLRDARMAAITGAVSGFFSDLIRLRSLSGRDRAYLRHRLGAGLRALVGEERRFRTPAGPRLHMNLLPGIRGGGVGTGLLEALLQDLRGHGVARVHANSYQSEVNRTERFWLGNGFTEYSRVRTSAWEFALPGTEVELVCYSRSLLR